MLRRALGPLALALACSRGAIAQEAGGPGGAAGDVQAARALFEEGTRDEQAGRWGEALAKFQRVLKIKETASGRFHAAYCEEKLGRLASAYADYKRALELARSTQGPDRKLIVEQSAESIRGLEARVPEVSLRLPKGVEGARVSVDDVEVPAERAAGPLPLDPGPHTLSVSAPGRKPFGLNVLLKERDRPTVVVNLEPLAAPPAPAPAGPAAPPAATAAGPAEAPAGSGGASIAPWVVGGASVALAGVGAGFFLVGRGQADDLDECREAGVVCDRDAINQSRTRNYALAGAAGVLSLVGAGVAIAIALSGGDDAPAAAKAAGGLVVTPQGLGWAGRF
ncbi:MAG TPA: hypothetical protein VFS43_34340 [Polyangiaceae bacterium]|nr:hypothetical protein [Polyangiaceae bacterium]